MKIKGIVGCEYSGIVREAFNERGHDFTSCDFLDTERPGAHYKGDIFHLLCSPVYSPGGDLAIFHPPCTFMSNSGVRWLFNPDGSKNIPRWKELRDAIQFFNSLRASNFKRSALENPIPHKYARDGFEDILDESGNVLVNGTPGIGMYDQTIQPYEFGHTTSKRTCLWLNNLPKLKPTQIIPKEKRTQDIWLASPGPNRWKERSRTFTGIADAMADQWGSLDY